MSTYCILTMFQAFRSNYYLIEYSLNHYEIDIIISFLQMCNL